MIDYYKIKEMFGLSDRNISKIESVGDVTQFLPMWAALFFMALFPVTSQLAVMNWLYIIIINQVVVSGLKEIIFKFWPEKLGTRPNGGEDSMPSGHTAASFAGAAMFHVAFGWEFAIFPYVVALFTGFSRIAAKKHHFRDTALGAIIGVTVTFLVQYLL